MPRYTFEVGDVCGLVAINGPEMVVTETQPDGDDVIVTCFWLDGHFSPHMEKFPVAMLEPRQGRVRR